MSVEIISERLVAVTGFECASQGFAKQSRQVGATPHVMVRGQDRPGNAAMVYITNLATARHLIEELQKLLTHYKDGGA